LPSVGQPRNAASPGGEPHGDRPKGTVILRHARAGGGFNPMAICDYCGTTYRGGAKKDGAYRYCGGLCHERGRVLLSKLDHVPQSKVESFITLQHAGPCPSCGQNRSVDVYRSSRIWSALVYSTWQTNDYVACQKCARM